MKKLYAGGPVLTMGELFCAEAVLTEGGRILRVGKEAALRAAAPEAEEVRLEGRTLMPAFVDSHSHFAACAHAMLQCSVAEERDFDGISARLRRYIREKGIKPGEWVAARDLDPARLQEKRLPDRRLLDEAAPENPVILQHRSGHSGVLSTLALKSAGITSETPDPEGGRIERENGRLTGRLEEAAFLRAVRALPRPSAEELVRACGEAQRLYASFGIATVQEGLLTPEMLPLYRELLDRKALRLDAAAYADPWEGREAAEAFPQCVGRYWRRFKLGGYKIFLDGSPQSRTAWMREPYPGGNYRGYPALPDAQVEEAVGIALAEGRQLLAHCNGDAAAEQFLRALEKAKAAGQDTAAIRPVMIHAQLVGKDQLARFGPLGLIPSFFAAHVYHWGGAHLEIFGPERAAGISPAASAGRLGLPYTLHQDAPVIPPDMMETVWCAVNRVTREGVCLGPEERISVKDALRAVTVHAARQCFEEGEKGSLEPGKRADLVILDRNPLKVPPMELNRIRVLETVKDGETVYRRDSQ